MIAAFEQLDARFMSHGSRSYVYEKCQNRDSCVSARVVGFEKRMLIRKGCEVSDVFRTRFHARPHHFILTPRSMSRTVIVGVLALQGAFIEHIKLLQSASNQVPLTHGDFWSFREVRTPSQLEECDALIIPGGESTTVSLVASRSGLLEPLRDFVK